VALETWSECGSECEVLGALSFEETVPEVEPGRVYELDRVQFEQLDRVGMLKIITARDSESQMLGYISWTLQFDPESRGRLIAMQGPMYVKPGTWGVAWKIFMASLEILREYNVRWSYPHTRHAGRQGMERFLRRLGARPAYTVWALQLGPR
jgi:hypothetical protein